MQALYVLVLIKDREGQNSYIERRFSKDFGSLRSLSGKNQESTSLEFNKVYLVKEVHKLRSSKPGDITV